MLFGIGLILFFGSYIAVIIMAIWDFSSDTITFVGGSVWLLGAGLLITGDIQNFNAYEKRCLYLGGHTAENTSHDGWKCWTKDGRRLFLSEEG